MVRVGWVLCATGVRGFAHEHVLDKAVPCRRRHGRFSKGGATFTALNDRCWSTKTARKCFVSNFERPITSAVKVKTAQKFNLTENERGAARLSVLDVSDQAWIWTDSAEILLPRSREVFAPSSCRDELLDNHVWATSQNQDPKTLGSRHGTTAASSHRRKGDARLGRLRISSSWCGHFIHGVIVRAGWRRIRTEMHTKLHRDLGREHL